MKKQLGTFILLSFCAGFFACSNRENTGNYASRDSPHTDLGTITFDTTNVKGKPGFFRVGKSTDGQWWFIDADDNPFFYKGVCAINRAGTQGGRRAQPGPYAEAVDRKYHYQQHPDTFVYATIKRLEQWGFNAMGAWTTEEFFDKGMPYTEILEFFKEGPFIEQTGRKRKLPDIFDPEWEVAIDKKARALCSPLRNSRDLVGYFTDNEIGFGQTNDFGLDPGFVNAGRFGFSLLRETLGADPERSAYGVAWDFILEKYKTLENLSKAWNINISSKAAVAKLNQDRQPIESEVYLEDAKAFSFIYAKTYFKMVNEAIKRYDPNHLILGCRFGSPPDKEILAAMKPWVDVISQNNYRPTMYQRCDYLYEQTGLPVLIGEFSWNTDLFKRVLLPNEPAEGLDIKERMFRRGEITLLRTATHPANVGYTWYRWVQPTSTPERFTDGLVDYDDNEDIHQALLKKANPMLEQIRLTYRNKKFDPAKASTGQVKLSVSNLRPDWEHMLNLTVTNGNWDNELFGWQMSGTVQEGSIDARRANLSIKVNFHTWKHRNKVFEGGEGVYELILERDGRKISGTLKGDYNGQQVNGKVAGYFLEELPVSLQAENL